MRPALEQTMQSPCILEGTPPHLSRLLGESQRSTRFRVGEARCAAATTKGSRPGNALADFFCNTLFARTLHNVEKDLSEKGLLYELKGAQVSILAELGDEPPLADTAYADDANFPVVCRSNSDVLWVVRT
eukprot:3861502-Pyramimonas_sp.AAC.1